MAINVNGVTASQTQNDTLSSNQEMQRTNVQAAQNYGQATNTASSTHNLYHHSQNNLLGNKLLDPTIAQQIINMARLDKRLGDRYLSLFNTNSTSNSPPPISDMQIDDMYSKLMKLSSQGHLKNLVRMFNRRAKRGESTDQAYGSNNIKDEHADLSEKEKVKRKEGQTINENSINDVIKEGLRQHDTPFKRFLFLSMSVQNPSGNDKFDKAVKEELNELYQNHGVQIRANVHSLDEAFLYSKNPEQFTQFQDTYYQLIQAQTTLQMFSIFAACKDTMEFDKLTNLMSGMYKSAARDQQAQTLPTSDPNTIHNVLSFMHIRSSIISFIKSADKFQEVCKMAFSIIIDKSATQKIHTTIKQIGENIAEHAHLTKPL